MAKAKKDRSLYLQKEPAWKELALIEDTDELRKAVLQSMYFVHYEISDKVCIKAFKTWMSKHSGWTKEDQSNILKLQDWNFAFAGKYAFVHQKSGVMEVHTREYIETTTKPELLEAALKVIAVKAEDAVKPKVVPIRTNLNDCLNYVDLCVDAIIAGKTAPKLDQIAGFKLNPVEVDALFAELLKQSSELVELTDVRKKTGLNDLEDQLIEGYSFMTKRLTKDLLQYYADVEAFVLNLKQVKKITRIRKKKPTDKNKVVKRLRFLPDFKDLNIKSVNPVDIIGSTEVWYYDVKRKRLGVYCSDFPRWLRCQRYVH